MRRLPVHIWIREENATPDELAGYFLELARHLDECPRKMRLVVESTVSASLDFDPADGDPVVDVGGSRKKFRMRHRWIPEHPVPLRLGPVGRTRKMAWSRLLPHFWRDRVVLLIDPVEGNRFRVRQVCSAKASAVMPVLFSMVAVLAVVTLNPAAIVAALAILAYMLWSRFA